MVYVPPTISGYNSSPPSDDGSQVTSNKVLWSTIKTKLADPVKNYADSMNSAISSAFAQKFLGTVDDEAVSFSVGTTDDGKLFNCTSAITVTLPPASSAGEGFACIVFNNSTGTITVDGDGSETINGSANYLVKNKYCAGLFVCNGTGWFASGLIAQSTASLTFDGDVSIGGSLTLTGTLSGVSLTSGTVPYSAINTSSIATASEIRSAASSKLVDAAQLLTSLRPYSTTTATTSGTDVQFTSINTGIRRIVLVFSGVSSNGTGLWTIELGDSGGFETSGYSGAVFRDGGSSLFSSSFIITSTTVAADTYDGVIELYRGDSSTNTWGISGTLSATTGPFIHTSTGSKSLSAELDRLRVVAGGNTWDAGKITCEAFYF